MKKDKIKIFTTPICPWCKRVKEYLKSKEIEFEEVDVSKDRGEAKRMVERSGSRGVPQLWIGEEVVVGFRKDRIDELLEL